MEGREQARGSGRRCGCGGRNKYGLSVELITGGLAAESGRSTKLRRMSDSICLLSATVRPPLAIARRYLHSPPLFSSSTTPTLVIFCPRLHPSSSSPLFAPSTPRPPSTRRLLRSACCLPPPTRAFVFHSPNVPTPPACSAAFPDLQPKLMNPLRGPA